MKTGIYPNILKNFIITPILKSGDRQSVENHRPIAIISSLNKLLEKCMKHRLEMYLENNKRLMWTQFNKQLAEQVSNHFNECHETLSIFMNLVRAFDIVAHHIILRMHDIRGCKRY